MIKKIKNIIISNYVLVIGVLLFCVFNLIKARAVACEMGITDRWANLCNLLLLLTVATALSFFKRSTSLSLLAFASFILSLILFSDVIHYRVFRELCSASELEYAHQLGNPLTYKSILPYTKYKDIIYFIDISIWILLLAFAHKKNQKQYQKNIQLISNKIFLLALMTVLILLSTAKIYKYVSETKKAVGEHFMWGDMIVMKCGVLAYHGFDIFANIHNSLITNKITGSDLNNIKNIFKNKKIYKDKYFGNANGKNVVIIQLESFEAFVVGLKVYDQEVTPFLNSLTKKSVYFNRFFSQANGGRTSDAQFCVLNSLLPLREGALVFRKKHNEYYSLPKILDENGYQTIALTADAPSFYNFQNMWKKYGIEKGYFIDDIRTPELKNVDNIPDDVIYAKSLEVMTHLRRPFFSMILTRSTHTPFTIPKDQKKLRLCEIEGSVLGDYLHAAHFADEKLKLFFDSLKKAGLYDNSIFVIYGDHGAIPWQRYLIDQFETDREGLALDMKCHQRVPCFFIIPNFKENHDVDENTGQIDIAPTILNLLGISSKNFFLGENLMSPRSFPGVYFVNHNVIVNNMLGKSEMSAKRPEANSAFSDVLWKIDISNKINDCNLIPSIRDK